MFVRATADGRLAAGPDGRVEILYKKGGKSYRAGAKNLDEDPRPETWSETEATAPLFALAQATVAPPQTPDTAPAATTADVATAPKRGTVKPARAPRNGTAKAGAAIRAATGSGTPIIVYADGACSGNPGPAGLGVVLLYWKKREEISEYLGTGTNNVAELMAIVRALERAPRDRTVIIHSDSAYALGLLGKGWKAKANQDLVERMRKLAKEFRDLRLVKVAGHAGIVENERADELARDAVIRRA